MTQTDQEGSDSGTRAGEDAGAPDGDQRNTRLTILYSAIVIVLATVSARSVNNMIVTTLPFLAKYDFSYSNVMAGAISAAIYLSMFLVSSYLNPRLESSTRRKVFIASSAAVPVTMVMFYLSSSVALWPIAIANGLATGFVFPNIITSATLHRDHTVQMRLLAIYSLSLSTSLVIGPSLETWLLAFLSYKTVFLPFAILSVVGFAVSPFIKFPSVRKEVRGMGTLRNDGLISSIISLTSYNVPFAAIGAFAVIFSVKQFSVSSSTAYSAFISFFVTSFAVRLSMAIKPFKSLFLPLIGSAVVTAASLVIIPEMHTFLGFLIIMAVLGVPHGTIFPISSMLVARGTRPEERNVANSYFLAYNNILYMVVPVIFGYLSTTIGFGPSFDILSVASIASIALLVSRYRRTSHLFTR